MKYLSYLTPDGRASWGRIEGDELVDLGDFAPSLKAAMAAGLLSGHETGKAKISLSDVEFLPVITRPDKIICVGLNYRTHVLETGRPLPDRPAIFTRFANTQIGHRADIVRPSVSEKLDFEGELAVIISTTCRHVTRDEALQVVAGFACYNDGSVRDWQRHTHQFAPGKNFPGTGALGPWLVTKEEFGDVGDKTMSTRVNGEQVQHARLDDMIFDVPSLIEYCSTFTQLEPGDVIITGTTGGVGAFREPPKWLKPGDVVEVEIDGVGTLRNGVMDEDLSAKTMPFRQAASAEAFR